MPTKLRPASVLICGQPFSVASADLGEHEYGRTHAAQQKILIAPDQGFHQERDTLLHEVVHAAGELTGQEIRESAIGGVATALLAILRSNPELVAWLTEELA